MKNYADGDHPQNRASNQKWIFLPSGVARGSMGENSPPFSGKNGSKQKTI